MSDVRVTSSFADFDQQNGFTGIAATGHGSSEGHEMLKRNDKYHSIADDVPIPKM